MQLDPRAIQIRTDGSCYRDRRLNSGCAAIVEYPEHLRREPEQIVDFGCAESSINRMELLGCLLLFDHFDGFRRITLGQT